MQIYLECLPCFVRQALEAARLATENEQTHEQVLREALRLALDMDMRQSPPAIGQQIHRVIRRRVGHSDPYRELKQRHNRFAMQLCTELRNRLNNATDPWETTIRLAIAGNIIDLGVKTDISDTAIESTLNESLTADFDSQHVDAFKHAVHQAEQILYLTDNAGEIAFDRLLIEKMPTDKVTVAVRGKPVINDATMEDAEMVGLTRIVEVIDNGSDAPGTILAACSRVFRDRFNEADLIIAKGQGNYETLNDSERDMFFILKAKCPVIARDLHCAVGDMILQRGYSHAAVRTR